MTAKSIPFLIVAALACVAPAQTPPDQGVEKVFHFTYIRTHQGVQEIVNTMRSIVEFRDAAVDNAAGTLTVRGTANQLALAGWLFPALDRPAGQPLAPLGPGARDYRLAGSSDAVVRVFSLAATDTPQMMQEMVNGLRSILELQRVTLCNANNTLIARGTAEQIAASEWMIDAVDKPAGVPVQATAPVTYALSDPRNPAARIFYLTSSPSPQTVQEIVNSVRSLADLQRVVACYGPRAIAVRGTADQVAMAAWVIGALDKPASTATASTQSQYQLPGSSDVARIYYLAHPASPQALQEFVSEVRSTTNMPRVTLCNAPRALALRGTSGQVAIAEKIIQDRDKM